MKNSVAALGRNGKRAGHRKQPFLGAHRFGIVALAFLVAIWSALGGSGLAGTLLAIHAIDFPDEFQFGRDITWDGLSLWTAPFEKLVGPTGGSDAALGHVFALDPADGSVQKTFAFGAPLAERSGIAWDGSHLWVTLTAGVLNDPAPTIPDHVVRLSTDGEAVGTFELPYSPNIHVPGMAFDGTDLWVCDATRDQILRLDPTTLTVLQSWATPGSQPQGLAWGAGSLWCVDGADNVVYQLTRTGNVLETWTTGLDDPFGVAHDGEHVWVLDNGSRTIVQFAVPEPSIAGMAALGIVLLSVGRRRVGTRPTN